MARCVWASPSVYFVAAQNLNRIRKETPSSEFSSSSSLFCRNSSEIPLEEEPYFLSVSPQFATSMILVDDDESELVTSGKFLKMGTLGPTLLIKSKSADTRRWCTHSQVETTNSSQQTYGRVYYRYSEAFEFKDGLLH